MTAHNSIVPLSAAGLPVSNLDQITHSAIREIHQTTNKLVNRLNIAEKPRAALSTNTRQASNKTQDMPYQFSKNVLDREQLNELINMKEAKKLAGKKRGSTQIEPHQTSRKALHHNLSGSRKRIGKRALSNARSPAAHNREQKIYKLHMTLAAGSGLVLESTSVPKQTTDYQTLQ